MGRPVMGSDSTEPRMPDRGNFKTDCGTDTTQANLSSKPPHQQTKPSISNSPSDDLESGGESPVDSLRSNHISIVSLNDDDDSSSLADSDSDLDEIHAQVPAFIVDAMRNGAPTIPSNGMIVINNGASSVSNTMAAGVGNGRPNIGSIALQNSSDITFGDKTFYQGPVTVKQFFLEKDRWRSNETTGTERRKEDGTSGFENGAFVPSDGDEKRESEGK